MIAEHDEAATLREALDDALRRIELEGERTRALQARTVEQTRENQRQIRNILSVVRSIVRRTVAEGEEAETYQARLESRLSSFTRLQANILRGPGEGVDLYTLITDELLAFGLAPGGQADIDGEDIRLTATAAGVIGLAVHELSCLVISDSAVGTEAQVHVRWQVVDERHLRIEWTATGRSSAVPDADFGRDFVQAAVQYELDGEVWLDEGDDGLVCRFLVPMEHVAAAAG